MLIKKGSTDSSASPILTVTYRQETREGGEGDGAAKS